jgi:hypothetical protein
MFPILMAVTGCGRAFFEPIGAGVNTDADSTSRDAGLLASYCAGWTYCDTFDGDFSIADWEPYAVGNGTAIAVSNTRSKSGANSLRMTREPNRGVNDNTGYKLTKPIVECEYDVFAVDTFGSTPHELETAAMSYSSPDYVFAEGLQAVFANDGAFGRWATLLNGGGGTGGQSTKMALAPITDTWIHVAMQRQVTGGLLSSSTLTIANSAAQDSRTLQITPNITFTSSLFILNLFEPLGGGPSVDVFFDNVRCR